MSETDKRHVWSHLFMCRVSVAGPGQGMSCSLTKADSIGSIRPQIHFDDGAVQCVSKAMFGTRLEAREEGMLFGADMGLARESLI